MAASFIDSSPTKAGEFFIYICRPGKHSYKVRTKRISVITLAIAGIVAIAVVFSHFSKPAHFSSSKAGVTKQFTVQHEAGGFVPLRSLSVETLSLPAAFHFRTNLLSWFLFKVFHKTYNVENYTEEASPAPSPLFEIIFTLFISPNAP